MFVHDKTTPKKDNKTIQDDLENVKYLINLFSNIVKKSKNTIYSNSGPSQIARSIRLRKQF